MIKKKIDFIYKKISLMIKVKKNKRINALKEVKHLCKKFVLIFGVLKATLADGQGGK